MWASSAGAHHSCFRPAEEGGQCVDWATSAGAHHSRFQACRGRGPVGSFGSPVLGPTKVSFGPAEVGGQQ